MFVTILCLEMASASPSPDPSLDAEWQEWKRKYEKTYSQVGNILTVQRDLKENDLNCKEFLNIKVATETSCHQELPKDMSYELKVASISYPLSVENVLS